MHSAKRCGAVTISKTGAQLSDRSCDALHRYERSSSDLQTVGVRPLEGKVQPLFDGGDVGQGARVSVGRDEDSGPAS